MNAIENNLKRTRLLKKLSLKEAGKLLNMTATTISKYEKGEILPDSTKLIAFANAYGVKSIDLLKAYDVPEMKFTSLRKKATINVVFILLIFFLFLLFEFARNNNSLNQLI